METATASPEARSGRPARRSLQGSPSQYMASHPWRRPPSPPSGPGEPSNCGSGAMSRPPCLLPGRPWASAPPASPSSCAAATPVAAPKNLHVPEAPRDSGPSEPGTPSTRLRWVRQRCPSQSHLSEAPQASRAFVPHTQLNGTGQRPDIGNQVYSRPYQTLPSVASAAINSRGLAETTYSVLQYSLGVRYSLRRLLRPRIGTPAALPSLSTHHKPQVLPGREATNSAPRSRTLARDRSASTRPNTSARHHHASPPAHGRRS